jgi:thiamine-monophosphate kinase
MKLFDLGEFALIERMTRPFGIALPSGSVGPGDDCAILPGTEGRLTLITTDLLIEGVHFLRREISAPELGHKALAVNLSDIAAMGGTPKSFLLSLGLPPDLEIEWVDGFIEGMSALAREYGLNILGGDTTKSLGPIVVNIALMGEGEPAHIKLRSAARPKDIIAVTGFLGDSAAGLRTILENAPKSAAEQKLRERHHKPRPHLREGQWLGGRPEVHAMMDISDGLNSDIQRIMDRSQCGARIELTQLPVSPELKEGAKNLGWDARNLAAGGGEDYCLLCTVDCERFEACARDFREKFGTPLYRLGEITDQTRSLDYLEDGRVTDFSPRGVEHFYRASEG